MEYPVFSVDYIEEYEIDETPGTQGDFILRILLLSDTGDKLAVEIHSDHLADIIENISRAMRYNGSSSRRQ